MTLQQNLATRLQDSESVSSLVILLLTESLQQMVMRHGNVSSFGQLLRHWTGEQSRTDCLPESGRHSRLADSGRRRTNETETRQDEQAVD